MTSYMQLYKNNPGLSKLKGISAKLIFHSKLQLGVKSTENFQFEKKRKERKNLPKYLYGFMYVRCLFFLKKKKSEVKEANKNVPIWCLENKSSIPALQGLKNDKSLVQRRAF